MSAFLPLFYLFASNFRWDFDKKTFTLLQRARVVTGCELKPIIDSVQTKVVLPTSYLEVTVPDSRSRVNLFLDNGEPDTLAWLSIFAGEVSKIR